MRTTLYVHRSKEANAGLAERLGITGAAERQFLHALSEVAVSVEVDVTTGLVEIVEVNGRKVEAKR